MAPSQHQAVSTSTPTTVTTSTRRQSCDRCYGQKLRCTRQGKEGTCNRCLRQGAQCVYSFSLPKGRPPNGTTSAAALARLGTPPRTPIPRRRCPAASRPATVNELPENSFASRTNTNDNRGSTLPAPTQTFASAANPWHFNHTGWNNLVVNPQDLTSHHAVDNSHSVSTPTIDADVPYSTIEPLNLSDWRAMREHGDCETGSASGSINSSTSNNIDSTSNKRYVDSAMSGDSAIYDTGFEQLHCAKITQLSQLSTRLCSLQNSGGILAKTAELSYSALRPPQSPLFDDACYRIVAGWFVHLFARMQLQIPLDCDATAPEARPTGEILHSVFSASHYLLDILRLLQREGVAMDTPPSVDLWTGLISEQQSMHSAQVNNEHLTSYFDHLSQQATYPNAPSTVIRHLVIACHTQILNIYVTVLIALQHDAALKNFHIATDGQVEDDTRIALVVQLCAYLLERQRQAVDLFFAQLPPMPPTQNMSFQTTPPMSHREMIGHLEMDVQQRLARIQHMLRI